jgi:hypothetical protein
MIRPFTLVCMLMAGAAGLYLYQSKHRAQMLDRDIGKTIKQTEQTRERIGMLKAEWALLNEPDRLAELARAHLGLRTLLPTQFAAVGDLAARLPAPVAPTTSQPPTDVEPEEDPAPAIAQAVPPPKRVAVAAAPAALGGPAAEPKPAAESKPARPAAEVKAAPAQNLSHPKPVPPVQLAVAPAAPPRPVAAAPVTPILASSAATAPGTIGEAVLRAMRANATGQAPQPFHATAPQAAYVQPIVAAPGYAAPSYASAYAAPAGSVLGGSRGALPPPVPFATR